MNDAWLMIIVIDDNSDRLSWMIDGNLPNDSSRVEKGLLGITSNMIYYTKQLKIL